MIQLPQLAIACFPSSWIRIRAKQYEEKLNKFLINEEEKENMSEMGNILGVKHFIKIQCNCDRELIHHSVHLLYNKRYSTETRCIFQTDWNRKKRQLYERQRSSFNFHFSLIKWIQMKEYCTLFAQLSRSHRERIQSFSNTHTHTYP